MHIQYVYNLDPLTGVFDSMMQSWIYTLELLREIFKSTAGVRDRFVRDEVAR